MTTSLLFAHPRVIALRNRLRQSPVLRSVYASVAGGANYEARFSKELLAAVRPGDTVWDVGANVGVYAAQFAELGAAGVVCFEPAPAAVTELRRRFPALPGHAQPVRIIQAALAAGRSTAAFTVDGSSPNNQITTADGTRPTIEVQVYSGDEALTEFELTQPNVIKVDVEGFELEVIQGLSRTLSSKALRSVFIEVHFSLLHTRGLDSAPASILETLRRHGFQVKWVDPSHIGAHRH